MSTPASHAADPASPPPRTTPAHEIAAAVRGGLKLGVSLLITWSVAMVVKLQVPAHLGPVRQGHFAFAESFAGMFFMCLGLGIDTYVMKEVSVRPKHASDVVGGIFALRGIMSLVLLAAMTATLWVTGRPPEILFTAVVFAFANLVLANNATLSAVLQATSYTSQVAVANVVTKIAWGAGLLMALHYSASLPILALALPASDLLRTAILVPVARRGLGLRYRIDVRAVRRAVIAAAPYFVNALALGALGNLGMSVLEFVRTDEREVGWFASVQNLAALCALLSPLLTWVVMPLLSRAYARSEAEGLSILRRSLEGLVVVVAPMTVLVSAGSDVLIHLAFGDKYAPAATGLAILSLVFVMTYLDTMLAIALTIMGRGWSVTLVSFGSVLVNAALMLAFVPLGRRLLGVGGECAGAAASVITTEVFVFIAMVSRYEKSPLDARIVRVLVKSVVAGALVLVIDRRLRSMGAARLAVDGALYVALALGLRIVRIAELRDVFRTLRQRKAAPSPDIPSA